MRSPFRFRWLAWLLVALALPSACLDLSRPDLAADYGAWLYPPETAPASAPGLRVTHFGTTTLLFDDGETRLMIDGFFTRPSDWFQLFFGQISSDQALIRRRLESAGVKDMAALMVFHSHYDHAMDIGPVAQLTGAEVLGSESTANIARGAGLPEQQIKVVTPGRSYAYGKFRVTFLVSQHTPLPPWVLATGLMGDITEPLRQPVSLYAYREGETYAIHIAHPLGISLLKGGSLIPGELAGYHADTVFMCTPGLDKLSPDERKRYFRETVLETGAKLIVPVHWDDFSLPLEAGLQPMPRSAEDLDLSMDFLLAELRTHPELRLAFIPALQPLLMFPQPAAQPASTSR